jgi:hypothetical protein
MARIVVSVFLLRPCVSRNYCGEDRDMLTILKRKASSGLTRLRRIVRNLPVSAPVFATRSVNRFRYARIVERMHLAVCTPCQYDCESCSHQGMRYQHKNYHMSLGDLRKFLHFTEASGYFIEKLHITGPGEPLLWKNLREGLALLRASPAIGCIDVVTNGLELSRIDEASWKCIDILRVSLYPASAHIQPKLQEAQLKYRSKMIITTTDNFRTSPELRATAPVPCECGCTGPMYFDGKVFYFCGPTVFGAGESKGVDVLHYPEMYGEIGLNYLEVSRQSRPGRIFKMFRLGAVDREKKTGNHELCKYCFANNNFKRPKRPHIALPLVKVTRLPHPQDSAVNAAPNNSNAWQIG